MGRLVSTLSGHTIQSAWRQHMSIGDEQRTNDLKPDGCVFSEPYFGGITRAYSFPRQRSPLTAPEYSRPKPRFVPCWALRANASK